MADKPWQLQLVNKSLKKKEKLRLIAEHLQIGPHDLVLDLGCAQGILSYFLRKKGGQWLSADLDLINLKTSQALLEKNLLQIEEGSLPFRTKSLDAVVCLDYLEHLDDDQKCLQEIYRILKPGGQLILATPRTGFLFFLNKLRPLFGMKLEYYGHKREGYSLKALRSMLTDAGLNFQKHKSFSGFFTELAELKLNFFYTTFFSPGDSQGLRDGHIRPATANEFSINSKAFKLYAFVYPLIYLFTRLDKLFFFQRNYGLMVWAKKTENFDI